ncbi:imidazoleglycerol-phosphate dehydratase [Candidatus Bathyarchaeota archaeon ex4484_205]|nr:MAG: imidazoleglycerol-phosphate dehydratase [Candidatus Bathyarchaeota archaeon ex4484_205]RLG67866.1 MAG: imidazoleglycerol-phosphate dehydratase [archaeon]
MCSRYCEKRRTTEETDVLVKVSLDEGAEYSLEVPYPFFKHLLQSLARFSGFKIEIIGRNLSEVDEHHLVEDVAITLGEALDEALGDRRGIARYGDVLTPMDEVLVLTAIDLDGRGGFYHNIKFRHLKLGEMDTSLIIHFLRTLAIKSRSSLHIAVLREGDEHHLAEAIFKSLGRSLGKAVRKISEEIPSTKGVL